jgi:hypothetical protein
MSVRLCGREVTKGANSIGAGAFADVREARPRHRFED